MRRVLHSRTYVENSPRLTFEKVKAGVFIGPEIRQLFKDQQFEAALSDKEKAAWQSFEKLSNGFLGKFQSCKFRRTYTRSDGFVWTAAVQYVAENALLKFTPGFFPLNCGEVSDEHGEGFHQDTSVMEHSYKGNWSAAMLGDYCWMMKRGAPETKYHRQAKRTRR